MIRASVLSTAGMFLILSAVLTPTIRMSQRMLELVERDVASILPGLDVLMTTMLVAGVSVALVASLVPGRD